VPSTLQADTLLISVRAETVRAAQAQTQLKRFVSLAWSAIEPQPFVDGWHIGAVCEHLQAVSDGQIRNLIINIPPRHTKSLTTSVIWPAWEWGPYGKPQTRWMFTSYAASLAERDSVKCRRLIQSPVYQRYWGHVFNLMGDQNAKERYDNNKGGYRLASGVDGVSTGEGGDRLVVDDPHKLTEIYSAPMRKRSIDWWDQAMATRGNNPLTSARVIIMKRGHQDDLTGHILSTYGSLYEVLMLPAEYEPKRRCVTSLGFPDKRTKEGELLWKNRFDRKAIDDLKKSLGRYGTAAQLQQRPDLLEGNIIQHNWLRFYRRSDLLTLSFDFVCQSWDMTFKDTRGTDYVAGQVWGICGANYYLLDRLKRRMAFIETQEAVTNMAAKWPQCTAIYVENTANGPAIIDSLKRKIRGIIPVNVSGEKTARLIAVSPIVEAGNVYLPSTEDAPWVTEFIDEICSVPNAPNDDEADAFSQALNETARRIRNVKIPEIVSVTKHSVWR